MARPSRIKASKKVAFRSAKELKEAVYLWLAQYTLFDDSRLPYGHRMSTAGQFIVELQRERRIGNVSSETEQHLKHEFRTLGRDASDSALAAAVGSEMDQLSRG